MANLNSSQKSSWAPLAIGALVILIIIGVVYYYYYTRANKECVKKHVKYYMPGADDAIIDAVTEWEAANTKMGTSEGKCEPGFKALAPPPGVSCTVCEVMPPPIKPAELQNKVSAWAATPPAKEFMKSLEKDGRSQPASMS